MSPGSVRVQGPAQVLGAPLWHGVAPAWHAFTSNYATRDTIPFFEKTDSCGKNGIVRRPVALEYITSGRRGFVPPLGRLVAKIWDRLDDARSTGQMERKLDRGEGVVINHFNL